MATPMLMPASKPTLSVATADYTGHINSSLLAEAITSCLEELSQPLVTSQLSGVLLAHLSAVSEGSVKMYVVKCLLEQLPGQHHGRHMEPICPAVCLSLSPSRVTAMLVF